MSRIGTQYGCTWRTLRVPDWRLVGQCSPWCPNWSYLTLRIILDVIDNLFRPQRRYLESFELTSLLEECQEKNGGQEEGSLKTLRVSDRKVLGQGHPWCHEWISDVVWPRWRFPESFVFISLLELYQELGIKNRSSWRTKMFPDQGYCS